MKKIIMIPLQPKFMIYEALNAMFAICKDI